MVAATALPRVARPLGRYVLHHELAAGGMATIHLARLRGTAGFGRTVAIKRLHAQFAKDPEFVSMFLDEARLTSRIQHPNVVSTLDVVAQDGELFVVMEYLHGESLANLWRLVTAAGQLIPQPIAIAIIVGVLQGLDAAHEARDEAGAPLHVIHRDVSPQNILVGADGVTRVLDFGVARAASRVHTTRNGELRGKLRYMAPEQLRGEVVDRRADLYAATVVLWELLSGERLFAGDEAEVYVSRMLSADAPSIPRSVMTGNRSLDAIIERGLAPRESRLKTARETAAELESAVRPATTREVADWVATIAGSALSERAALVAIVESGSLDDTTQTHSRATEAETPAATGARIVEAAARRARAAMTTERSLPALTGGPRTSSTTLGEVGEEGETLTSTTPAPAPRAATRSLVPSNPRRRAPALAGATVLLTMAGLAAVLATARDPGSAGLRDVRSSAVAQRPDAWSTSPPPSSPAEVSLPSPTDSRLEAALPMASAPAVVEKGAHHPLRGSHVTPRPQPPSLPATSGRAGASSAPRSPLCMQQRADGVVYFEPCR